MERQFPAPQDIGQSFTVVVRFFAPTAKEASEIEEAIRILADGNQYHILGTVSDIPTEFDLELAEEHGWLDS